MVEDREVTCNGCKWYKPSYLKEFDGTCHRKPPTAVAVGYKTKGAFPTVDQFDWCGEYERGGKDGD